eukprot:TRINITY_DN1884_c0_g1_i1.p1 TRINITY_DN1884_c0_g1~~TRINITY_DN1884_c0_g1_i1.p1  ORF type:complete len:811 (-),score=195.13 TRINITY_DN1884_c0_g1_i1:69-2291(-)
MDEQESVNQFPEGSNDFDTGSFLTQEELKMEGIPNDTRRIQVMQPPPPMDPANTTKTGYRLRMLGVPQKSRVETQLKLCLQLINSRGATESEWKSLFIPEQLLVTGKRLKREDKTSKSDSGLILEAGVVCSSDPNRSVLRCYGCIQRERKSTQRRKKTPEAEEPFSIEEEQQKILQFYSNAKVDFSSGEAIIPTRITCYCRHHEEKNGFQIWINLRDSRTQEVIASGLSSEIMITDDHKSKVKSTTTTTTSNAISNKRSRSIKDEEEESTPRILALVERIVPCQGPITGGVEATILGKDFTVGLKAVFGDMDSLKTDYWGPQTLLTIVPPSLTAGPVPVTIKGVNNNQQEVVLFTYKDESERMMMELALQVVGMKLTGKIDDAKQIALRIVNSNQDQFGPAMQFNYSAWNAQYLHKGIQDHIYLCLFNLLRLDTGHSENLNIQNASGHSLLMLAVITGCHPLVRLLLENGADVNLQDKNGFTALHFAGWAGYQALTRVLLGAPAVDIHLVNKLGQTVEDLALLNGHADIVDLLHHQAGYPTKESTPPLRYSSDLRRASMDITKEATPFLRASVDSSKRSMWASQEHFDVESQVKVRHTNPVFNMLLTGRDYLYNYKVLIILAILIAAGATVLANRKRKKSNFYAPPKQQQHEDPIFGGDVLPPRPGTPEVGAHEDDLQPELLEEHHYWIALTLYFMFSGIVIAAIAYKYRRVWKIKTVVISSCVIFASFVLCQTMVLETL